MNEVATFVKESDFLSPLYTSTLWIVGSKVLYCVLVLVVCGILIRVSRVLVRKFFTKQAASKHIAVDERKAQTMNSILSSIIKYVLYFIAFFTILQQLGIDDKSLLAVAGAGSVAIGLGAKGMIEDMLDGFFILFEDHFGVGDIVTIQENTGVVEAITLRTTRIRDASGTVHIIPNGSIGTVSNMSKEYMNAVLDIGVAYEENLDRVLAVLKDEMSRAAAVKGLIETPEVLGVVGLNECAVTVRIVGKCEIKENYGVERELKLRIKNRLDKEHIAMPFPQRTVHIVQNKTKE